MMSWIKLQTFDRQISENTIDGKPKGKRCTLSVFKGILLAMLSGICFSSAAAIVKRIRNIEPEQMGVYYFLGMFVLSLPEAIKTGKSLLGPHGFRILLFIRGTLGATNIIFSYYAFRYLPLGDASVIIFSVPVFVTVAARIFLKERCGMLQSIAVLLTIIGIVLTTKLPLRLSGGSTVNYTKENIIGLVCATTSLFFNTGRYIVMRKTNTVHHAIVVFTSAYVSLFQTILFTSVTGNYQLHYCGLSQLYIILFGFLGYSGQMLLTMALQFEQAGPVSTMRASAEIILSFLWQMFLFHNIPDSYSVSGATLVVTSVIFIGLEKWAAA